jgi:hypothetical protein
MKPWKNILIRSAGFGGGFALVFGAIIGLVMWHTNRPKAPKPWDKHAISAEYDYVRPEGEKDDLRFNYVLQNNTDLDYRAESDAGIDITGKLKAEKEFSEFAGHYVTTEYPIFIPARSRVRCFLQIPYPYPVKEKSNSSVDERQQYTTEVAKYVTEQLGNLDGFVLFDSDKRYEIDFPSGWEQRAKEGSAKK